MEPIELAREIIDLVADKKGSDIVLLDIRQQTVIADYFVICSGSSERQMKAIVNDITSEIKQEHGRLPRSTEGEAGTGWILVDYADVILHVFAPSTREFYDLESFWDKAAVLRKMP